MDKVRFKTPVGELRWVFIDKGGMDASAAKDKSKMVKKASLFLPKEKPEVIAMVKEQLAKIWEDLKAANGCKLINPKSNGLKAVKNKETGEETGDYMLEFKTMATWKDGSDVEIPIYNAKGEKTSLGDTKIGNGSIGVIHGEAAYYSFQGNMGVTLYLKAIQVAKLVPYDGVAVEAEDISDASGDDAPWESGESAVTAIAPTVNL